MTMPDAETFRLPLRIFWEDTDAGGIVFYANYLKFFERARTEWLRARGCSQEALRTEQRMAFVVTDTRLRFVAPARLDDLLEITVGVERAGQASLRFFQQALRAGAGDAPPQLIAEGTVRIGCVDLGTFRPCRIPTDMLDAIR